MKESFEKTLLEYRDEYVTSKDKSADKKVLEENATLHRAPVETQESVYDIQALKQERMQLLRDELKGTPFLRQLF